MKNKLLKLGVSVIFTMLLFPPILFTTAHSYAEETSQSVESTRSSSTTSSSPTANKDSEAQIQSTVSSNRASTSVSSTPVQTSPSSQSQSTVSSNKASTSSSSSTTPSSSIPQGTDNQDELRAQLQKLVDQGNEAVKNAASYTDDSIKRLKTTLYNAQVCLDRQLDYSLYIRAMTTSLNGLVPISTTEPSTTVPSSSSTSSSSTSSSSTSSSSTSSSSTSSSSTSSSSTSSSSTSSSSTSSSSTTEKLTPQIKVSDKTMRVGEKLTSEDILAWAQFENCENYYGGFEIVGSDILVTQLGSTLVQAGVHKITYYVANSDSEGAKRLIEKSITLTILDEKNTETDNTKNTGSAKLVPKTDDSEIISSNHSNRVNTIKPSIPTKKLPTSSSYKGNMLPKTGEEVSWQLVTFGVLLLTASVVILYRSKVKFNS